MVLIRSENTFKGLLQIKGRNFCFEVECNEKSEIIIESLQLDWRLHKWLGSSLINFLKNKFDSVQDFYTKFYEFVNKNLSCELELDYWALNPLDAYSFIKTLQEELRSIGEIVKSFNIEDKLISLEIIDDQFRSHKAVLKLPQNYPRESVIIVSHNLPIVNECGQENTSDWIAVHSVLEFSKKFEEVVNVFQDFWNLISLVDANCWVLDPPSPTFKDVFRRIKLSNTLSVAFTVNPYQPRQLPIIKLFGRQTDVDNFQEVLQKNLSKDMWDCNQDLIYNISNVLDVTIPNKMFSEDIDMFGVAEEEECAICYEWRLNNEIPNEICEKITCKSLFHTTCLFTYLSSISKNQLYFGKIQGQCPNCEDIISCSVPKN